MRCIRMNIGAGFVTAAATALVASTAAAQAVLPANVNRSKPAMHIVLDTSGSMYACDGQGFDASGNAIELNEAVDLTRAPNGGYLFNPRTDTRDDGQCRSGDRADGRYPISRLEAAKLAMSRVLDADKNGTINSADEELLGIKMGFSNYDTNDPQYRTARNNVHPIGTPYDIIWRVGVQALQSQGNTPTGPAIAGARALSIANCFDGNAATFCSLGEKQQDALGDDISTCRDYYIVSITDGFPNTNSQTAPVDPVFVSHWISKKGRFQGESSVVTEPNVRVISVGLGVAVTGVPSDARGSINCTTWWSSAGDNLAADANLDRDDNVNTMGFDEDPGTANETLFTDTTTGAPMCGACTVIPAGGVPGNNADCDQWQNNSNAWRYGNGYFAKGANDLVDAMLRIINAVQAGTFTRSEPVVNPDPTTTTSDDYAYTAMFTVSPTEPLFSGDLQSFRLGPTGFVHCDTGGTPSTGAPDNGVARPCWKAGEQLRGRDFRTRVLYFANPLDYPTKFAYQEQLGGGPKTTYFAGDASAINRNSYATVKNFVPSVSALPMTLTTSYVVGAVAPSGTTANLYRWAEMATLRDATQTYRPNLTDTIPPAALTATIESLRFASGNPQARYLNGKQRGGLGDSTTLTTVSRKLLDSYNGRPVIIGPPVGLVTDADYINEFRTRRLDAAGGALSFTSPDAPRFGSAAAYAAGFAPSATKTEGQDVATPCRSADVGGDMTKCTVSKRRTIAYLAANDGMVHAIDASAGTELWAFTPPSHMYRLAGMRDRRTAYIDGVPIVRDVKFPCLRDASGACTTSTDAYADGKWHTVLIYNQGLGGNFFFALDITNPVAPVFLWDFKAPDTMGLTVAAATLGEIPSGSSGYGSLTEPGSAVFLPGGYDADGVITPNMHTVTIWDGQPMYRYPTAGSTDLSGLLTSPGHLVNGLTGAPRAIDGNLDGDVDRVYFGDREGRMWKACAITPTGDFQVKMYFDPAVYDYKDNDGDGDGDSTSGSGPIGQPLTVADPTSGLADADARKRLRGPLYFSPDITRSLDGDLIVVFGSGNILDPLNPPLEYYNFLWSTGDEDSGDGCGPALDNTCTAGTETFAVQWQEVTPIPPTPTPAPTPPCPCQAEFTIDVTGDITFNTIVPDETGGFPQCRASAKPNELVPPRTDIAAPGCRGRQCSSLTLPAAPMPPAGWNTECGTGVLVVNTSGTPANPFTSDPCTDTDGDSDTGCVWDPTANAGSGEYDCGDDCRDADDASETYCRQTLEDWRRGLGNFNNYTTMCMGPSGGPPAHGIAIFDTSCGDGTMPEPCGSCRRGNYNPDGSNPLAGYDVFAGAGATDGEMCNSGCGGASRDYCLSTGAYAGGGYWNWRLRNELYPISQSATLYQPNAAIMSGGDTCNPLVQPDGTMQVVCEGCSSSDSAKHGECSKMQFWFDWNQIPQPDCPCAYATPTPPPTPPPTPTPPPINTASFSGLMPLRDLLSTPPSIFNKLLFYAEFEIGTTICTSSAGFASRLWNRDVFTCGDPPTGTGLFSTNTATGPKPYKELPNRLVTGVEIVPRTGQMVINASGSGSMPQTAQGAALQVQPSFAGWRQRW